MQVGWLIFIICTCICPLVTKSEIKSVLINQFALAHPGFATLLRTWTLNQTSWTLIISCYNAIPTTTDYVYSVPDIEFQLSSNITPTLVTNKITWPNSAVAADALAPYSMIIPSGYYIPTKTSGNLYYINKADPIALVPNEKTNWFYHDAAFKDVDRDGHIDIVAGRVNVPVFVGTPQSQLIWLKNPGNTTITGPWKLNFLMEEGGPDINVQFAEVDGKQVLFANSFFTRKLQLFWSNSDPYWNNTTQLHVRHIDYEPLQYYHIQLTMDLNGDDKPDLLVTVNNGFDGSLIVYEFPPAGQLLTGIFPKHVIASGFKPAYPAKGRGSPGQGIPYQFYSLTVRKKPIIILSGDDDDSVYLLEAVHDDDPSDWQYTMTTIYNSTGTIGQITVEDVDNDGHPELFIPAYNEGMVYIYRLLNA